MSITGDTGHGFTMTFATSGLTVLMRELDLPEEVLQIIDASYVGDGDVLKIPGDTIDHGEFTGRYVFNPTAARPALGTVETTTFTFPKMIVASAAPATFAGTAFMHKRKLPNLQSNQLQEGSFAGVFNGDTGPTFTAEA